MMESRAWAMMTGALRCAHHLGGVRPAMGDAPDHGLRQRLVVDVPEAHESRTWPSFFIGCGPCGQAKHETVRAMSTGFRRAQADIGLRRR
jgi:hypothetical protein